MREAAIDSLKNSQESKDAMEAYLRNNGLPTKLQQAKIS
jgi:hypothetical protein